MKTIKLITVVAAGFLVAGFNLLAADAGKETTITGNMVCGKCTLHETKSCQNVVQVMKDGKTVNYYLTQNDASKSQHEAICGGSSAKVTVSGLAKEVDGKEMLTASKIEVLK
jgi:hypothetical protein